MRVRTTICLSTLVVLVSFAAGCGTELGDAGGESTIELPLRRVASDGAIYRLSGSFIIDHDGSNTIFVDAAPSSPSVAVPVAAGHHVVTLASGWTLERSLDGASFAPVPAVLSSVNPQQLDVLPFTTAQVQFNFVVRTPSTLLQISFGVDPSPGEIAGTMTIDGINGVFDGYSGHQLLYRIYQDATLSSVFVDPSGNTTCRYTGSGTALEVFNDSIGRVVSFAHTMTGSTLSYEVTATPSGSQILAIRYGTPDNGLRFGPNSIPPLPLDANSCPQDPAQAGLATAINFILDGRFNGQTSTMVGTSIVQFVSAP